MAKQPKRTPGKVDRQSGKTTYTYVDLDGIERFQVIRTPLDGGGKTFTQRRRIEGVEGWVYGLKAEPYVNMGGWWRRAGSVKPNDEVEGDPVDLPAVERVLYRWPEWADSDFVCLVEGEKDADALWSWLVPATTCAQGAASWVGFGYEEALRGKRVHLFPDNDAPGIGHMVEVARSLQGIALKVYLHRPFDECGPKGDVSDWIALGHTVGEFRALVKATEASGSVDLEKLPEWAQVAKPKDTTGSLDLDGRQKAVGKPRAVDPLERVLDALRAHGSRVDSRGIDDYMAQCPAHDDTNPSLRVKRGENGKASVECYASCTVEAIMSALGLKVSDLYADEPEPRSSSSSAKISGLEEALAPLKALDGNSSDDAVRSAIEKALSIGATLKSAVERDEVLQGCDSFNVVGKRTLNSRMKELRGRHEREQRRKAEEERLRKATDLSDVTSMEILAARVNELLNTVERGTKERELKAQASGLVVNYFLQNDRFLVDSDPVEGPDPGIPYVVNDDQVALPLMDRDQGLRVLLNESGVNASEPAYRWIMADMEAAALKLGRKVRLARWAKWVDDTTLYVSCGRSRLVVARVVQGGRVEMSIEPNGTDGVLFAADASYPAWEPCEAVDPYDVQALRPFLESPAEVPAFTAEQQQLLMVMWAVATFTNIRHVPVLLSLGDSDGGKTTLLRMLVRLIHANTADVSTMSRDERDWGVSVSMKALHALDNMDEAAPDWFPDLLATAATGGSIEIRKLYSNNERLMMPITAAVAISSRTARFAERPDIQSRLLPLFFGEMDPSLRRNVNDLEAEVSANRSGILTWMVEVALSARPKGRALMPEMRSKGVDTGRFDAYVELVVGTDSEQGIDALANLKRAQRLAVTDPDELLQSILEYFDAFPERIIRGGASAVIKELQDNTEVPLPNYKGGKRIARKLREMRPTLDIAGIHIEWEAPRDRSNGTTFELRLRKGEQSSMKLDEDDGQAF
ncbi:hypothetical protein KQI63_15680 [bacterium]|nr:hypothetical protein [bacterium]